MKNKKGFTLIELLGIIIILAVIILLIVPVVDNTIQSKKEELYDTQIDNISLALKNWGAENMFSLPTEEGGSISVTLGQLKQTGFIGDDVVNPVTGECFPNDMLLTITRVGNTYKYDVDVESGSAQCDEKVNKNAPIIALKGKTLIYVEVNTPYVEPGLIVTKSDGTPISQNNVEKTITGPKSTLDTSVLGTYQITYKIEDSGIINQIVRTVIVRDTIAPEITLEKVTTISTIGQAFNVMEGVSASDNSGVEPTITHSGTVNTKIPGTYTITYTATDTSGNSSVEKRTVVVNDTGTPTLIVSISGSPFNTDGWSNGDVKVRIEASDTSSGISKIYTCTSKNGKCTPNTPSRNSKLTLTFAEDTDNGYICAYTVDASGNKSDTVCSDRIRVDKTPPTCTTSALSGTAGIEGWYRSAVSVTGTCSDNLSTCVEATVTNTYGSNTTTAGTTMSPGTVTDKAGNSTKCPNSANFKIDLTAPTCTTQMNSSANSKGWYQGASVSATGVCSDSLSTCRGNSTATVSAGRTTITPGDVMDKAGNTASCPGQYVQVDNDSPTQPDVRTEGKTAYVTGGSDGAGICWYKVDSDTKEGSQFDNLSYGWHNAYAIDCAGNASSAVSFEISPKVTVLRSSAETDGIWRCIDNQGKNCPPDVYFDTSKSIKINMSSVTATYTSATNVSTHIVGTLYTNASYVYTGGDAFYRYMCLTNHHGQETNGTYCQSNSVMIKDKSSRWNTKTTYPFDVTLSIDNPSGCYDIMIYSPTPKSHITTVLWNAICTE